MKKGPVVLVPGTESLAQVTFAGLGPLMARDYDVRLFDFRSVGEGGPEDDFECYVEQLNKFIDETGDEPVHLLGYSLGAHIALHVAAEHPQVASLCLIAGWLRTDDLQRERHDLWLDLYEIQPDLAGRLAKLTQYSAGFRSFLAEQQVATVLTPAVPTEETCRRVEVNKVLNSTEAARKITVPTLLISGLSDFKVSSNQVLELYGAISGSTLLQTSAGHAVLRERLGQVYGGYFDFLQGATQPGELISTLVP